MRSMDLTQQLWKGNAPSVLSLVVVWRSLLNTAKVSIILTVVTSISYVFLQSTSCKTTDMKSTKSVPWLPLWKQVTKVTSARTATTWRQWNCQTGRANPRGVRPKQSSTRTTNTRGAQVNGTHGTHRWYRSTGRGR